ncbi:ABC transporter permease [Fervidobacterium thailandense]|nr:ABC transporter permease [Fervidobacterium thailandense]
MSFLFINFRDRFVFFMNIALPVVFLILFGSIFGKGDDQKPTIAFYSDLDVNVGTNYVRLSNIPSVDEIKSMEYDAVIVAVDDKIDVYVKSPIDLAQGEFEFFRLAYASAKSEKKLVQVRTHELNVGRSISELEYTLLGVITISFLSIGLNAGVRVYSDYVRYGLFKRFNVTPIDPLRLSMCVMSAQIITGIISSVLNLFLSLVLFGANLFVPPNMLWAFLLAVVAAVMINLALGILVALIFKKAAPAVSQLVFTILIFFSGVYFPVSILPRYLRIATYLTPPRYVHLMLQKVYGVETLSWGYFWFVSVAFILIGALLTGLTTRKFLRMTNLT